MSNGDKTACHSPFTKKYQRGWEARRQGQPPVGQALQMGPAAEHGHWVLGARPGEACSRTYCDNCRLAFPSVTCSMFLCV